MNTNKSSADGATRSIVLFVLPGLLAATLTACGGGGDNGTGSSTSGSSTTGSSTSGSSSSGSSGSGSSSSGSSGSGSSSSGSSGSGSSGSSSSGSPLTPDQQSAVDAVNAARQEVNDNYLYPHVHLDDTSGMWVGVAPLEMAHWDADIAADAQASAEATLAESLTKKACLLMDGANPKDYGQNVAWNDYPAGSMMVTSPFTAATNSFIAEKAHYNYKWTGPFTSAFQRYNPMIPMPFDAQSVDSTPNDPSLPENQGYSIGHYTPIIWAQTTAFGCGFATAMLTDSSGNTSPCNQYVCFYGPAQTNEMGDYRAWCNLLGDPPY